jgi:hypothetical protein
MVSMSSNEEQVSLSCTGEVPKSGAETKDEAVKHIEKYSVQLIDAESTCPGAWCSGVLVELGGHYFIFTAGHCAPNVCHPEPIVQAG